MRMRTASRLAWVGAAIAVLALAVVAAGCGSSNNNSTSTSASSGSGSNASGGGAYGGGASSTSTPASTATGAAVVSISSNPKLGKFLVDSKGNTLYYFENDKQNGKSSACTGSCASVWPAYTTSGTPKAQKGASASKLGTISSGSSKQVTYNGWPLYKYSVDSAPGQTNGEDIKSFGGTWYVLTPAGNKPAGS